MTRAGARSAHGPVAAGLVTPRVPHPEMVLSRPSAEVLRLDYRGWTVEVIRGRVVLPRQVCSAQADPGDLAACVAAATSVASRSRAGGPVPAQAGAAERDPDRAVAGVLAAAAAIAARSWDRRYCDLYACLSRAWADHGHAVAYAALTRSLRPLVDGGNLLAFNDSRRGADIVELFTRAAAVVETQSARRGVRSARHVLDRKGKSPPVRAAG